MEIRRGKQENMEAIMDITRKSQAYFRQEEIPQWTGDYPNENVYLKDMEDKSFYILIDQDQEEERLLGFMAALVGREPSYARIYEGAWLNPEPSYLTIHRMAVDPASKGKGRASFMMDWALELAREKGLKSIRIDTHRRNKSMLRLIEKNGFSYCGIVYMADGGERLAYEKMLED